MDGICYLKFCTKIAKLFLKNLVKSGKNSIELKKVLNYYKNEPEKRQAIYFLISNMDYYTSKGYVSFR
jgi:hypothetical protein